MPYAGPELMVVPLLQATSAWAPVAGFISALVAITGLWVEGRRRRLALYADLMLKLDERFNEPCMRATRATAAKCLLDGTYPDPAIEYLFDYFSTIAILVDRGAFDLELSYQNFGYWVIRYWWAAGLVVEDQRQIEPDLLLSLEAFVAKLEKRKFGRVRPSRARRLLSAFRPARRMPPPSDHELQRFLREEAELVQSNGLPLRAIARGGADREGEGDKTSAAWLRGLRARFRDARERNG